MLIAFIVGKRDVELRPAPLERDWMDASGERFAYRCLPLSIANAYGWEILCPSEFHAVWDGSPGLNAVKLISSGERCPAVSHFGHGILTFPLPYLFRTASEIDLLVQGPINRPKDGISPLTGIIETDWSPYTFTMNWKFTRSGHSVCFAQGEPFCHIFPQRRGELEMLRPEIKSIDEDPELKEQYEAWKLSRAEFNRQLRIPESSARSERWQKNYHQGRNVAGKFIATKHRTRVVLRKFALSLNDSERR